MNKNLSPAGGSYMTLDKVKVNRERTSLLYLYLKSNSELYTNGMAKPVPWNFSKFLVSKNGVITAFQGPRVSPLSMEPAIRKLLAE